MLIVKCSTTAVCTQVVCHWLTQREHIIYTIKTQFTTFPIPLPTSTFQPFSKTVENENIPWCMLPPCGQTASSVL